MQSINNLIWGKIWESVRAAILEEISSSVSTELWDGVWALVRRPTRFSNLGDIERSIETSIKDTNGK